MSDCEWSDASEIWLDAEEADSPRSPLSDQWSRKNTAKSAPSPSNWPYKAQSGPIPELMLSYSDWADQWSTKAFDGCQAVAIRVRPDYTSRVSMESTAHPAARYSIEAARPDLRWSVDANRGQCGAAAPNGEVDGSNRFISLREVSGDYYISPEQLRALESLDYKGAYIRVDKCVFKDDQKLRTVAKKGLSPGTLQNEMDMIGFAREVGRLHGLHHRNLAEVYGVGCDDDSSLQTMLDSTYVVQAYFEAGTLCELLKVQMNSPSTPQYTFSDALHYCQHIASATSYLHRASPQVIHGDLKLSKVLLGAKTASKDMRDHHDAEAVVTDFGMMAITDPKNCAHFSSRSAKFHAVASGQKCNDAEVSLVVRFLDAALESRRCTLKKETDAEHCYLSKRFGSYVNMAPELIKGDAYDEKIDVFAFGCCMFELFSRQLPTAIIMGTMGKPEPVALQALELYAHKVAAGYRQPIPPTWPAAIRSLIQDCWATSPAKRPSMDQILTRLSDYELVTAIVGMDNTLPKGTTRMSSFFDAADMPSRDTGSRYFDSSHRKAAHPFSNRPLKKSQGCGCLLM